MNRFFFIVLALICSLIITSSCDNDRADQICMGAEDDMKIEYVNLVAYADTFGIEEIRLNIDGQWQGDISIQSYCYAKNGAEPIRGVRLKSLNDNYSFLIQNFDDSTFLHYDVDTTINSLSGNVIITSCRKEVDYRISEDDTFYGFSDLRYVKPLANNDAISTNSEHYSDNAEIFNSGINNKIDTIYSYQRGDTLFCETYNYYFSKEHYPEDDVFYIGVYKSLSKLGWIKLKLEDINKVTVLETALQK